MHYKKIESGDIIIEFHNNWLGEETVIVNGQRVSKKSSIWGTHHHFTAIEKGHQVRYVLTTKVDMNMQVFLDLKRNGEVVQQDIKVGYGGRPRQPQNIAKKKGMAELKEYDLVEAIKYLTEALAVDSKDPEIHFYLACAYSVQENLPLAYEHIKKAVANKLQDTEVILNHDMLAYLRLHDGFERFLNSNFSEYDADLLNPSDEK